MSEVWIWGIVLGLIVLTCYLGPLVFPLPDPEYTDFGNVLAPIGATGHWLGTDGLGRDLLSRCLYGGRVSLTISVGAVALGMTAGSSLGILAGYRGGWVDAIVSRCLDVLFAFPGLVLALTVASYLGPSLRNVMLAIAFYTVPAYARVARSATLRVREQNFVRAAEMFGASGTRIGVLHILPNVLSLVLTYAFVLIGIAMIIEAGLSFLGLGVPPPQPSWGQLIAMGKQDISGAPHIALVPGAFLFLTIAAFNRLGDLLQARNG
ncbi:MAG: ABC transporter permease [Pseudomonadota bacterium]|nr:ABC transporter permease [Pseudomonadota bacterium]